MLTFKNKALFYLQWFNDILKVRQLFSSNNSLMHCNEFLSTFKLSYLQREFNIVRDAIIHMGGQSTQVCRRYVAVFGKVGI